MWLGSSRPLLWSPGVGLGGESFGLLGLFLLRSSIVYGRVLASGQWPLPRPVPSDWSFWRGQELRSSSRRRTGRCWWRGRAGELSCLKWAGRLLLTREFGNFSFWERGLVIRHWGQSSVQGDSNDQGRVTKDQFPPLTPNRLLGPELEEGLLPLAVRDVEAPEILQESRGYPGSRG